MRILLLTAATGAGHIKAANAVEAYIRENTGWDVRCVDCLKAVGRLLDKTVVTFRYQGGTVRLATRTLRDFSAQLRRCYGGGGV